MAAVLELAFDRRAGLHRHVVVASFQRLHPGLLVGTDDVLVDRRIVIEPQECVALAPKLFVLRVEPHLLPMRLEAGATKDATDGAFAHRHTHARKMLGQQRGRPVRNGDAHILRRATRFRDYACTVGFGERECGRPVRGASASLATGSSWRKRCRHFSAVRS